MSSVGLIGKKLTRPAMTIIGSDSDCASTCSSGSSTIMPHIARYTSTTT